MKSFLWMQSLLLGLLLIPSWVLAYGLTQNYWQEHGPAAIIPHERVFEDLNREKEGSKKNLSKDIKKTLSALSGKARACFASDQPHDLPAVKEIFKRTEGSEGAEWVFESFEAPSGIARQPLGVAAADQGARHQIQHARQQRIPSCHYWVAFQSFFTEPTIYQPRSHVLIRIENADGEAFRYISDGIEVDSEIYDLALDAKGLAIDGTGANETVGQILAEQYGVDPVHWQAFLTQDRMNRIQQIVSGVHGSQEDPPSSQQ